MMIRHHLSDSLLMAYSAAQLPEAFNLITAAHLSMCDDCRARLGAFDAIGGAMIEDTAPKSLGEDCLSATLARICGTPPGPHVPHARHNGLLPAPLHDYIGGGLDAVKWRNLGMGVRQSILPTSKGATARLLYIPAGQNVPDHGHRGLELTLVLQGAFRDETDRFAKGDIEIADEALNHKPVAESGQDCICLAATDAPLRFNSLLPRLAQPFFHI